MAGSPCSGRSSRVTAIWQRIPDRYREIGLDAVIVMPDHLHGILFTGIDPEMEETCATVGDAVRWFKTVTVRAYRDNVKVEGWNPYERHLWQPKFHDRIIRDPGELDAKRAYIAGNPGRWWERHEAEWAESAEPVVFRHRAWEADQDPPS
jgi:REP element-mobilizing transposase RayT